jgi:hypothetical protein
MVDHFTRLTISLASFPRCAGTTTAVSFSRSIRTTDGVGNRSAFGVTHGEFLEHLCHTLVQVLFISLRLVG